VYRRHFLPFVLLVLALAAPASAQLPAPPSAQFPAALRGGSTATANGRSSVTVGAPGAPSATPQPSVVGIEGRIVDPALIQSPTTTPTPTPKPVAIELDGQAADGVARLTWRISPLASQVSPIIGFSLFYGFHEEPYDHRIDIDVPGNTDYQVTGLENGRDYGFVVAAYDAQRQVVGRSQEIVLRPDTPQHLPSAVERRFVEEMVDQVVSRDLRQFGYDPFSQTGGAFDSALDAPPGPDYRVGPGDVLEVFLWGQVDGTYVVPIDADGAVKIPNVGVISLSGLTLAQATGKIEAAIRRQFSGFHLSVTLKELHTIQVYVMGEVRVPGSYRIGALSTVFNALFAATGPTKQGSLRTIRLRRASGDVVDVDLYDFLLTGNRAADLRLGQGDTVFIPLIGATVGVTGQVKRPAIYELKPGETLRDALEFAGGVTADADPRTVQIERVEGSLRRVVEEVSWAEAVQGAPLPLQAGDLVSVRSIYPQVEGRVEIAGQVKQPGYRPWHPGMRLSDILTEQKELLPGAFLDYAEVRRVDPVSLRASIVSFSPAALLAGQTSDDLELADQDKIHVFSETELARQEFVEVQGEVANPGRYPFLPGMRVRDLIYQAGNLTSSAYLPEAEITRLQVSGAGTTTERIYFSLENALDNRGEHNQLLQSNDQLFIRAVPDWSAERVVSITGEVRFPGSYAFRRGERISEILERAGGFTPRAFLKGAIFNRESVREIQAERLQAFIREQEQELLRQSAEATAGVSDSAAVAAIGQALADRRSLLERLRTTEVKGRMVVRILPLDRLRESAFDLELEEGDQIAIPPIPWSVNVLGRVYNPTSLIYEKDRPVSYYLDQTGGVREDADDDHIYLVRADGTVISRAQERGLSWWWSRGERRWFSGRFDGMTVERGDTLLVPEEPITVGKLAIARDITQILANIAVSAGNLKFLFQ